jgi:hypothetical protein
MEDVALFLQLRNLPREDPAGGQELDLIDAELVELLRPLPES